MIRKIVVTAFCVIIAAASLTASAFADSSDLLISAKTTANTVASKKVKWDGKTDFESNTDYIISGKISVDGMFYLMDSSTLTIKNGGSVTFKKGASIYVSDGCKISIAKGGKMILEKGSELDLGNNSKLVVAGSLKVKSGAKLSGVSSEITVPKGGKVYGKGSADLYLCNTAGKGTSTLDGLSIMKSLSSSQKKAFNKPLNQYFSGAFEADVDKVYTAIIPEKVYKALFDDIKSTLAFASLESSIKTAKEDFSLSLGGIDVDKLTISFSRYAKASTADKENYTAFYTQLAEKAGVEIEFQDIKTAVVNYDYAGDDNHPAENANMGTMSIIKIDGKWYLALEQAFSELIS